MRHICINLVIVKFKCYLAGNFLADRKKVINGIDYIDEIALKDRLQNIFSRNVWWLKLWYGSEREFRRKTAKKILRIKKTLELTASLHKLTFLPHALPT